MNDQGTRGFSLLEAMIALSILALGAVGSLAGIASSNQELREGQLRQYKMLLLDAKNQRRMLEMKTPLTLTMATSYPVSSSSGSWPPNMALGTWNVDTQPLPMDLSDLSTGAYFQVLADGEVAKITTVAPGTTCGSTALTKGTYCREWMLTAGPPTTYVAPQNAIISASGTTVMTYWTRVSRVGEDVSKAVYHAEVLVQ